MLPLTALWRAVVLDVGSKRSNVRCLYSLCTCSGGRNHHAAVHFAQVTSRQLRGS